MAKRDARSGPYALVRTFNSVDSQLAEAAHGGHQRTESPLRIRQADREIIRGYLHERCLEQAASGALDEPLHRGVHRPWMPGSVLPPKLPAPPLPTELERKLSAAPAGYQRLLVDHNVLLVQMATREIVDVMRNACATDGLGRCVAREATRAPEAIAGSAASLEHSASRLRH